MHNNKHRPKVSEALPTPSVALTDSRLDLDSATVTQKVRFHASFVASVSRDEGCAIRQRFKEFRVLFREDCPHFLRKQEVAHLTLACHRPP